MTRGGDSATDVKQIPNRIEWLKQGRKSCKTAKKRLAPEAASTSKKQQKMVSPIKTLDVASITSAVASKTVETASLGFKLNLENRFEPLVTLSATAAKGSASAESSLSKDKSGDKNECSMDTSGPSNAAPSATKPMGFKMLPIVINDVANFMGTNVQGRPEMCLCTQLN